MPVWFMSPSFKSYLSYKFDQPEMIRDLATSSCLETLEIISSPAKPKMN